MKEKDRASFAEANKALLDMCADALARREFLVGSAAFGATLCLPGRLAIIAVDDRALEVRAIKAG